MWLVWPGGPCLTTTRKLNGMGAANTACWVKVPQIQSRTTVFVSSATLTVWADIIQTSLWLRRCRRHNLWAAPFTAWWEVQVHLHRGVLFGSHQKKKTEWWNLVEWWSMSRERTYYIWTWVGNTEGVFFYFYSQVKSSPAEQNLSSTEAPAELTDVHERRNLWQTIQTSLNPS